MFFNFISDRLPGTGNSHWMKLNEKQFKTWTIDTSEFQIQCFGGQWNIWTDGVVKYYVILSNRWDLDIVIKQIVYDLLEKKSRDNSTANLVHARHEWSRGVCSTTSFLAVFWNRKKWSPGKNRRFTIGDNDCRFLHDAFQHCSMLRRAEPRS